MTASATSVEHPIAHNPLWRKPAVREESGLSNSSIYDLVKRGLFPRQIAVSDRRSAWIGTEVIIWCELKIALDRLEGAALEKRIQELRDKSESVSGKIPEWVENVVQLGVHRTIRPEQCSRAR